MARKKEIIYFAHCVLNQNSVIRGWERAEGAFNSIVREILAQNIGIVQLPCPEFSYFGEARPPKTKAEYDTPEYRSHCRDLAEKVIAQIQEYLKNDYEIKGLIGIERSPSCDSLGEQGIFIEELNKLLAQSRVKLKSWDIPEDYIEN